MKIEITRFKLIITVDDTRAVLDSKQCNQRKANFKTPYRLVATNMKVRFHVQHKIECHFM